MYKWPWSEMTWPQGTEQTVPGLKSSKGSLVQGEPGEEGRGRRKQIRTCQRKRISIIELVTK